MYYIFHHEYEDVSQLDFMKKNWDQFLATNLHSKIRWVRTRERITRKRTRDMVHRPFTVLYNLNKGELTFKFKILLLEDGEPVN